MCKKSFPLENFYMKMGFDFSKEPFEKSSLEFIKLYGKAYQRLKKLYSKPCHIDVSLSDEKNYAIANIVIHKKNEI